jgi:hypothetical protein
MIFPSRRTPQKRHSSRRPHPKEIFRHVNTISRESPGEVPCFLRLIKVESGTGHPEGVEDIFLQVRWKRLGGAEEAGRERAENAVDNIVVLKDIAEGRGGWEMGKLVNL